MSFAAANERLNEMLKCDPLSHTLSFRLRPDLMHRLRDFRQSERIYCTKFCAFYSSARLMMNWWFTNGHSYSMFRCLCWQSICHSECLDFDNSTENDRLSSPISSSKMSINTFPKFIQNDSTQLNLWCVLPLVSMCHALHSLSNRKSHSITNNNNSTHRANVWSPPPKT